MFSLDLQYVADAHGRRTGPIGATAVLLLTTALYPSVGAATCVTAPGAVTCSGSIPNGQSVTDDFGTITVLSGTGIDMTRTGSIDATRTTVTASQNCRDNFAAAGGERDFVMGNSVRSVCATAAATSTLSARAMCRWMGAKGTCLWTAVPMLA